MSDEAIVKVDVEVAANGDAERTGHPPGYHKSEDARARCWGCSHPERLAPKPGDEELAKKLVADGWVSTSNKYCLISRVVVPPAAEALTFHPDVPEWLRAGMLRAYEIHTQWGIRPGRRECVEEMTLTTAQFKAFKRAQRRTA